MNSFCNRNAYILIGLIPVLIYCLSCFLFETNAESSVQIKKLILDAVAKTTVSPVIIVTEYKARVLWQCSSLLMITAYLGAIFWSNSILRKCCLSRVNIIKIIAMGCVIVSLLFLQIAQADSSSAMYNTIFSTTYEALSTATFISHSFLQEVYIVITAINFLAAVTPVFILISVCSIFSVAEQQAIPTIDYFVERMGYLKQGVAVGSSVLLFGIIHMTAWMQWPAALFEETSFSKALLASIAAFSQFWGITFTLLLISFYIPAAVYLRVRVQPVLDKLSTTQDRQKWLEENGFTISFQKHALQLGMMLTPLLAGSFNAIFEFMVNK